MALLALLRACSAGSRRDPYYDDVGMPPRYPQPTYVQPAQPQSQSAYAQPPGMPPDRVYSMDMPVPMYPRRRRGRGGRRYMEDMQMYGPAEAERRYRRRLAAGAVTAAV